MRYAQSWQDFMRMPANKALKESKGIHACKQKYIQEQNKHMWNDPIIIQENNAAADPTAFAAAGGGGGGGNYITGHTAEVSTFSWVSTMHANPNADAASGSLEAFMEVNSLHVNGNAVDFTSNHNDSRVRIGLFIVTGSFMNLLAGGATPASKIPNVDIVVTASLDTATVRLGGVGGVTDGAWTGSILNALSESIQSQPADAVVLGFTNTLAPKNFITAATGSAPYRTLVITNKLKGGVKNSTFTVSTPGTTALTGSISTTTNGNDTYYSEPGTQVFDSIEMPFSTMPLIHDGDNAFGV